MVEAFAWGLFGALSLLIGALVVEWRRPGTLALGVIMAFGAGVLLSAVSFELVEQALETADGMTSTVAGFFTGAVVFTVGDVLIARLGYRNRKDVGGEPADAGALAIVLGTVLDGVPESAVLGLTILQTGEIGAAMLVAVFVSNLPESIAATTSLRAGGWRQGPVIALWSSIALVSGVSAALGFGLLDGASPDVLAFVFAFAAGAILTMVATSMTPEAYEHAHNWAGLATVLGFAVAIGVNALEG